MAPPILRDVALTLARSGAAGSQLPVQEAHATCWTGRSAEDCTVVAEYQERQANGALGPLVTTGPSPAGPFHTLVLGDLTPGAMYRFALVATPDGGGEQTRSQDHTFTATPGRLPAGPALSAIAAVTSPTAATVIWTTDPACAAGQVNWGASVSEALNTPRVASETGSNLRTAHAAGITGLTPATRYFYRVFQTGPDGNSTLSSLRTFTTPAS